MAKKGIIKINENRCGGCGFCEMFCKKGCVEMTDRVSVLGLPLPSFINSDDCIACGMCAWMCPHVAIEVYECVEASASA